MVLICDEGSQVINDLDWNRFKRRLLFSGDIFVWCQNCARIALHCIALAVHIDVGTHDSRRELDVCHHDSPTAYTNRVKVTIASLNVELEETRFIHTWTMQLNGG